MPVTVLIHGPFRTREAIRCDAEPASRASFTLTRSGTVGTPVARLSRTGWYTYQLVIAGDASLEPVTTPCGVPAESFRVQRQPKVTTKVSSDRVRAGDSLTDTVIVEGLGEESATVSAALFGPFPSRQAVTCDVPAAVDRHGGRARRRPVRHRAREAAVRRLLHLPRDHRRQRLRAAHRDGLRRRPRDQRRRGRAGHPHPDQRAEHGAGRPDHRHGGGHRARGAAGDGQRGAVGPLPDPRGHDLHGHPVLDRQHRRQRRRHLHDPAGHARPGGLLHVPRVDRRDRVHRRGPDGLRRGGRDDGHHGPPGHHIARLGRGRARGRPGLRQPARSRGWARPR